MMLIFSLVGFLRTIKDVKRRVVESVLEGVGVAERTVDDEFDMFVTKYQSMMQDLNECIIIDKNFSVYRLMICLQP
jgi:hypothetical protein